MSALHFHQKEECFKLNMLKKLLNFQSKYIYLDSSLMFRCSKIWKLVKISFNNYLFVSSSTILGVLCKDGIIMGTEKIVTNKMMVPGTDKRLYSININAGGLINGVVPDGRSIITRAREEASQYESMFGIKIPG